MTYTMKKTTLLSAACVAALSISGAWAQEADAEEEQTTRNLDTIVVTAQKREQSIQDVGITVNAQTEERIDKLDLGGDVLRLATVTPGLTSVNGSAGAPSYRIRGLGILEFNASFDGPVGVHVDEAFLWKPIQTAFGFFDVNRVEVLKGPQGTVFGRNTTAGAVNFYSNTPEDEFGAGFSGRYGRFDRLEMEGYVTGPISDVLSYRVAVQRTDHNGGPFFNEFTQDEEGDLNQSRVRGILEYDNDTTLVRFSAEFSDKEGELGPYDNLFQDIPGGASAGGTTTVDNSIRNPSGRFTVNQNFQQLTDADESNFQLRVEHDFGGVELTSITNLRDHRRQNTEDTDNTPDDTFDIDWQTGVETFSQELRLSGIAFDDRLTYLVGGYYEDGTLEVAEVYDTLGGIGLIFQDEYIVEDENWAIFANTEFALTDDLAVIIGARYTEEQQDIVGERFTLDSTLGLTREEALGTGGNLINRFIQVRPEFRAGIDTADDTRTDTSFDYKIGLNYNVTDDALLFASWSTGFRSGGFAFDGFTPLTPFEPESVSALELGAKTTWLDGALTWNTAVFWSETEDYQDTAILPPSVVPTRTNTGTLTSQGIETDLQIRPNENWFIQLGGAYVDAEISESEFTFPDFFAPTTPIPALGLTTVNTPELDLAGLVNYTVPINSDWEFDALANVNYQSERFLEPDNAIDSRVDGHTTLDATLSVQSTDGAYRFSVWGKNLTDENYLQYLNDIPGIATFLAVRAEPATYGVAVDFNF